MAPKKRGLGRGLDAIIPQDTEQGRRSVEEARKRQLAEEDERIAKLLSDGTPVLVRISAVEPCRTQPRKNFDEDALNELAESIKNYGLLTPILVRESGKNRYEIVAGERRWRASRKAGLKEIPVIVRKFTDLEVVEIALIENIQREDLDPIEEASGYQRLADEFSLTQEQISSSMGKSRAAVANSMRLLKLSREVQEMVSGGKLSAGHARALIPIEDEKKQKAAADKIVFQGLSVRQTEKLAKDILTGKSRPKKTAKVKKDAEYAKVEEQLSRALGTKVVITPAAKGGKIEIDYYDLDDLDRLIDRII